MPPRTMPIPIEFENEVAVSVGCKLKAARSRRGMTMRTLADASGFSEGLISKIENGKAMPSLLTLVRLAGALGVTPAWVLRGCGRA